MTSSQGDLSGNGVVGEVIPLFPANNTSLFRFRNAFSRVPYKIKYPASKNILLNQQVNLSIP